MDFFSSEHASLIWLAIGTSVIIFEFFVTPGVGIVFVGLGAITTGALLEIGAISSTTEQLFSLAGTSVLWALLLWRPLKRLVKTENRNHNKSHIIGSEAIVSTGGVTKNGGKAKWSGTEMAARLAENAGIDELKAGEKVEVVDLEGSTLILKSK